MLQVTPLRKGNRQDWAEGSRHVMWVQLSEQISHGALEGDGPSKVFCTEDKVLSLCSLFQLITGSG